MFELKNIYVLNKKDEQAIVYEDANGRIVRLTREEFSSEEEFLHWKAWSDTEYHLAEKARHLYSDNTLSLEGLSDEATAVESVEQRYTNRLQEKEREEYRRLLMKSFHTCLTDTQRKRLWLYCVKGMTVRKIASIEKVSFQNVARSISTAKKKIKIHLQKQDDKTPISPR